MKTKVLSMVVGILITVSVSGNSTDKRVAGVFTLQGYGNEQEQVLTLAPWMTDIFMWEYAIFCVAEKEEPLELEMWMSDAKCWERNLQKCTLYRDCIITLPADLEGHVPLDLWMTDEHVWCNEYSEVVFVPEE